MPRPQGACNLREGGAGHRDQPILGVTWRTRSPLGSSAFVDTKLARITTSPLWSFLQFLLLHTGNTMSAYLKFGQEIALHDHEL